MGAGRRRCSSPTVRPLLVDGRIAAVGTHSELLATVPEYRRLLSSMEPTRQEVGHECSGERVAGRANGAAESDTVDRRTGLRLQRRARPPG